MDLRVAVHGRRQRRWAVEDRALVQAAVSHRSHPIWLFAQTTQVG